MGITKVDLFDPLQNEIAAYAKVLGHPARVAILQHLLGSNSCINGDLVEETGLAQATVSQHLKALKEVGLIKGSIEGTSMCYCIDPANWKKMQVLMNELFNRLQVSEGTCC